jgi:outer membrane protein TolC
VRLHDAPTDPVIKNFKTSSSTVNAKRYAAPMAGRRFGFLLLMMLSAPVHAEDAAAYVPPDFLSATPPLPSTIDASAVWRLDLQEALQLAVNHNLGVSLERKSVRVSTLGVTVAEGLFEPTLDATYVHGSSRIPPTTSQEGMPGEILELTDDRWRVSLAQRLATGMVLSVDFNSDRSRSSLGTAVAPLNYRSTLSVSVVQPLLRGFSLDRDIPQITVLQARLGSKRERHQLEVVLTDVVERTEASYWDLVQALFRYDLERRSHKRAEEQLALTRRQIDSGVLPPSDVIGAESTLAQRQLLLVQAEEQIQLAWDRLRTLINLPREQWNRPILPIDVPHFVPHDTSPESALTTALAHRPELQQMDLELQSQALAVRKAENDKLPAIDVGLTGTVIGQDERYGSSLSQLSSAEGRGWSVLVNFTWTPLRRATKAAAEIERTKHEVVATQRDQLVQEVWFAVRDAVRNQRSAARQVEAAAKFRALAEKSLDVEQRKFLNGTSSNFVVAQRQEELAAAQLAELMAVLAHTKAAAALARATGQLLDERHIELGVR